MKNVLLKFLTILLLVACSKEQPQQTRELKITLKSTQGTASVAMNESVSFYPNPFHNYLEVSFNGAASAQVLISNDLGEMKTFTIVGSSGNFDFSNEKSGAYYVEVVINNKIRRSYLIKQ